MADIAAGLKHTCVVLTSAQARCWGLNTNGQVGDNTTTERHVPVAVIGLLGIGNLTNGAAITAGESHTCVARTDGGAWCSGLNTNGQVGDNSTTQRNVPVQVLGPDGVGTLSGVVSAARGSAHFCSGTTATKAYCWGLNASGQLGVGGTTTKSVPTRVVQGPAAQVVARPSASLDCPLGTPVASLPHALVYGPT